MGRSVRQAIEAVCTICGSADTEFQFAKEGYDHFHCRSCTSLFLYPLPTPEQLAERYIQPSDEQTWKMCWANSRRHLWGTWTWALGRIESLAGRGPLLDLGCGAGQFLELASRRGWTELVGVELGPEPAAEAARRRVGDIYVGDLQRASLPSRSFAGVTAWDVIEHVADPRSVLKEVHRLLRPSGVLILSVPHRHGIAIRLLGDRALTVMPPDHLTYYTRRSLRQLLESAGFRVQSLRCADVYLREWARLILKARGRQSEEREVYGELYERFVQSGFFRLCMRVGNAFLNVVNLGDSLIAVSRRIDG
jgi:2-polyprenyl-3-methyl-5-hydroxy-6-metoxy-1,4-benzoquinol methylase